MTEIILARHGETGWNVEEVFRGRIDIELSETGVKQAELLAEYLSDAKIEAIYSSPLKRALKTAGLVAGYHQLDVEITPGLVDLDFGEWQGLPRPEVEKKYKELYAKWVDSPHQVIMPGGESLNEVRERAIAVVDRVLAEYTGTIVLVAHRVVNKVLICALLGLDNSHFWNLRQDTCGITIFAYEKKRFMLIRHNDTSFLKPIQGTPLSDF